MRVPFSKEQWDAAAVKPEVFTREGRKLRILVTDAEVFYGGDPKKPQPVIALLHQTILTYSPDGRYMPGMTDENDLMMEVAYAPTDEEANDFIAKAWTGINSTYTHWASDDECKTVGERYIAKLALLRIHELQSEIAAGKGAAE